MKVYHYAGCGTCKKALAWLSVKGHKVELSDLVSNPPNKATLTDLWKRSGLPLDRFFNTSGMSYRDGNFKDRLPAMTDDDKLTALAADGKLVKRPVFDLGPKKKVLVGFREAEWATALG